MGHLDFKGLRVLLCCDPLHQRVLHSYGNALNSDMLTTLRSKTMDLLMDLLPIRALLSVCPGGLPLAWIYGPEWARVLLRCRA